MAKNLKVVILSGDETNLIVGQGYSSAIFFKTNVKELDVIKLVSFSYQINLNSFVDFKNLRFLNGKLFF